jgi:hypothetical protein
MTMMLLLGLLAIGAPNPARAFEDEMIRVELPKAWQMHGEAGEYRLESDSQQSASLLLISFEAEQSLESRLAEIEQQFLSTGIITVEASEAWDLEGENVSYRRYRLMIAATQDKNESILMHQYSFVRDDVHVLLQVDTNPRRQAPRELIRAIVRTLAILRAPDPFLYEDIAP